MIPENINRDLIADLAQRVGTSDLLLWIEARTTELARLGWKRPGYVHLSKRLLAALGVISIVGDKKIADVATIRPQSADSYVIYYHYFRTRRFGSLEDHRFWVAHELAHTFWFKPASAGYPLSPHQRLIGSDPTIEWLCNRAAAALLVPRGLLEIMLKEQGYKLRDDPPPLHLIPSFARRVRVSPRLFARRWFHDILNSKRNVLNIIPTALPTERDSETLRFRIAWEAIPAHTTRLPRKLQGRLVRFQRNQGEEPNRTVKCFLDGRFAELVAQARNPGQRAVAFKRLPLRPAMEADIARLSDSIILSFNQ